MILPTDVGGGGVWSGRSSFVEDVPEETKLKPGSIDDKSTLDAISREGRGGVPG
jgi:hypothetical protein